MSQSDGILVISGNLTRQALTGKVAIVTGAGRGIGFETARSLAWLGAYVVIAEIDRQCGREAARRINDEIGTGAASFVRTDVGSERSVNRLARGVMRAYGRVDAVINNATVTPLGAVQNISAKDWDRSYRVNLRGPALLARAFLPGMLGRDSGVIACISSSPGPYMAAYETFKTAQVEMANTIAAELEGTGVIAFSVGPGLVPTPGAEEGIKILAPLYGKTVDEFYALSAAHMISAEAAGAGFAAAVALAERFRGQEIGAKQALVAAGIDLTGVEREGGKLLLSGEDWVKALGLCRAVRATLAEQAEGWTKRPLFERQWVVRDFRKYAGLPVEDWLALLVRLESALAERDPAAMTVARAPLDRLAQYYEHLRKVMEGYEKDPAKVAEYGRIVGEWRREAAELAAMLG